MLSRLRLVLASCLVLSALSSVRAAQAEPDEATPVVVAEDKTVEADCRMWTDSPDAAQLCDPGMVIFARKTTYGEAKRAGIQDYEVLTHNPQRDQALQDALVSKVHNRVKVKTRRLLACTWAWKERNGSYLSIPSNATSARISYTFQFTIQPDCTVAGVYDASQISAGQLQWLQSCSKGTANCSARGIIMTTTWSAYQPMLDTNVGSEYRHLSAAPCWTCGMAYGINTFQ